MAEDEEEQDEVEETEEDSETEETKKSSKAWLWIVFIAIVAAGVAWWLLSGDSATAAKTSIDNLPQMVGGC
mgnify:CR=1 FL=1